MIVVRTLARAGAWLLLLSASVAHAADSLEASVAPEVARVQRIAQGQEAEIPFLVVRRGSGNGLGMVLLQEEIQGSAAGYEFHGSPTASCLPGKPVVDRRGRPAIGLPVVVPQDSDRITCTYRIRRLAGARDMRLSLCVNDSTLVCGSVYFPAYIPYVFTIGDVPDFTIRVEPAQLVPRGSTTAVVRVVATNPTSFGVRNRQIATICAEFGGGIWFPAPFEIENDFPGACPSDTPYFGTECVVFDFDHSTRRLFRVDNLPPHGESSCLLRLRFVAPLQNGFVGLPITARDQVSYIDYGTAFDVDRANDNVPLGVAPADPPVPAPIGGTFSTILLAAGLLAALAVRRRTVR